MGIKEASKRHPPLYALPKAILHQLTGVLLLTLPSPLLLPLHLHLLQPQCFLSVCLLPSVSPCLWCCGDAFCAIANSFAFPDLLSSHLAVLLVVKKMCFQCKHTCIWLFSDVPVWLPKVPLTNGVCFLHWLVFCFDLHITMPCPTVPLAGRLGGFKSP